MNIGFFGTPNYAVMVLEKLKEAGHTISCVITMPDRPQGRKMILTPPPAKVWAENNHIPLFQPEKLRDPEFIAQLTTFTCDVFVVIAYGKIIPQELLSLPKAQSLNIHGSLLPKFRGSCPIETAILTDTRITGATIIHMDAEMDHGPIVVSREVVTDPWPLDAEELGKRIVTLGAELLIEVLPAWVEGNLQATPQNHNEATFTKKITKEDGCIDLSSDPYTNYLKIQAYKGWPSAYFFIEKDEKKTRVKITQASFTDGKLIIEKVIPEGKGEMNYSDLIR